MSVFGFIKRAFVWWDKETWGTQLYTWRRGEKVGEDEFGNTYYQAKNGQKRWVIYNGEIEASKVGADWHGWLHKTFKEPPTDKPLPHKSWEKPHQENLTGTPLAYAPPGSIRRVSEPVARSDYDAWSPE